MYNGEFFLFFSLLYLPECVRSFSSFVLSLQLKLTQRTTTRLVHSILSLLATMPQEEKRKKRDTAALLVIIASCQNEKGGRVNIMIEIFYGRKEHTFIMYMPMIGV
jgi:hypothetical protein